MIEVNFKYKGSNQSQEIPETPLSFFPDVLDDELLIVNMLCYVLHMFNTNCVHLDNKVNKVFHLFLSGKVTGKK